MTETINFAVSLALGIAARFLYILTTAIAKRTNLIPVTVVLDILTVLIVGGAFTLYVVLNSVVLAPYLFAALFSGYFLAYSLTKKSTSKTVDKNSA